MIHCVVFDDKHGDKYAVVPFAVLVDVLELSRVSQVLPHACRRNAISVMCRSQPLATLGSSSLQHEPAVLAGHARAKTVGFRPASVVWLKRALRHSDESPPKRKR